MDTYSFEKWKSEHNTRIASMKPIPFPAQFGRFCERGKLFAIDKSDGIDFQVMVIKESYRNRGIGSQIINYLKTFQKPIYLVADADKGKKKDLIRFYTRHGFVEKNGKMWWGIA